ncbi:MAG: type II secretion system F family protein, partial [Myxococcales bacterium]|nr:type II secretion system F family protein [Myxococcales bacterium]
MAEFVYEARARSGEVRKGVMEADTAEMVETRLKAQNLNPVKVKKKPKEIHINFGSPVSEKELV